MYKVNEVTQSSYLYANYAFLRELRSPDSQGVLDQALDSGFFTELLPGIQHRNFTKPQRQE